jgi:hypothetical protein
MTYASICIQSTDGCAFGFGWIWMAKFKMYLEGKKAKMSTVAQKTVPMF